MSSISQYDDNMKKLIQTLNSIIESGKYTMLVESFDKENTLEYGIIGQKMQEVGFDNLNGESFWEFMYKGIYSVEPNSTVNFMTMNFGGNIHDAVAIDLNERVQAIITNRNHKYDSFIKRLKAILESSEDAPTAQNDKKGPILSKVIKPLS